jgi:hypothetical protein
MQKGVTATVMKLIPAVSPVLPEDEDWFTAL